MAKKASATLPEGYQTITPSLVCRDAASAIAHYKDALGAEERMRMPGPDGKIMHAELKIGTSIVMLADESPEMAGPSPQLLGGTPVSFFVYVADVDAAFARAVKAGMTAEMPVTDMFWGDRAGSLADPFGHKWMLAQRVEELTPAEIEERKERFFAEMGGCGGAGK